MHTRFTWVSFKEMSSDTLYKVLKLRVEIFIEEQGYAYNDLDDRDQTAQHLLCWNQTPNELIGYARLMTPEHNKEKLEIGRLVVHCQYRKFGVGSEIMKRIIERIDSDYKSFPTNLTIAVDDYSKHLQHFYGKFGFILKSNDRSQDEHYKYKNFDMICLEMIRPSADQLHRMPKESKDEKHNTTSYASYVKFGVAFMSFTMFAFKAYKAVTGTTNKADAKSMPLVPR